jgi:hypothetical protein
MTNRTQSFDALKFMPQEDLSTTFRRFTAKNLLRIRTVAMAAFEYLDDLVAHRGEFRRVDMEVKWFKNSQTRDGPMDVRRGKSSECRLQMSV